MKTTAEIIRNATERANETTRVFSANARKATDAAALTANILQNAKTTKNVDRLFEFAATATADALADVTGASESERVSARRVAFEDISGIAHTQPGDRRNVNRMTARAKYAGMKYLTLTA
jgi:hypothetical protein